MSVQSLRILNFSLRMVDDQIMNESIVISRGRSFELRPGSYWHLAHPTAGFLFHNVAINEGICWSISAINNIPGLENAMSPYSLKIVNDKKEKMWNRVRMDVNPELPNRKGAISSEPRQ